MIYENVILTLLLLATAADIAVTVRSRKNGGEPAQTAESAKPAEDREKDKFNEGFENIMTFSVDGRDGFGEG